MKMTRCVLLGLVLVVLVVAVVRNGSVNAMEYCDSVGMCLLPCGSFLGGSLLHLKPSLSCCDAAKAMLTNLMNDPKTLCMCLHKYPPSFPILPNKAHLLSLFCNLNTTLPISPLVNCTNIP